MARRRQDGRHEQPGGRPDASRRPRRRWRPRRRQPRRLRSRGTQQSSRPRPRSSASRIASVAGRPAPAPSTPRPARPSTVSADEIERCDLWLFVAAGQLHNDGLGAAAGMLGKGPPMRKVVTVLWFATSSSLWVPLASAQTYYPPAGHGCPSGMHEIRRNQNGREVRGCEGGPVRMIVPAPAPRILLPPVQRPVGTSDAKVPEGPPPSTSSVSASAPASPSASNPNDSRPEAVSFWSTLPGILTGIAAIIAAIGGLVAVFKR